MLDMKLIITAGTHQIIAGWLQELRDMVGRVESLSLPFLVEVRRYNDNKGRELDILERAENNKTRRWFGLR